MGSAIERCSSVTCRLQLHRCLSNFTLISRHFLTAEFLYFPPPDLFFFKKKRAKDRSRSSNHLPLSV